MNIEGKCNFCKHEIDEEGGIMNNSTLKDVIASMKKNKEANERFNLNPLDWGMIYTTLKGTTKLICSRCIKDRI